MAVVADDLHALADAISDQSPRIKAFAVAVADALQPAAPTPTPVPSFTQGYSAAEVQALRTAGEIVAPKSYSVTFPSSSAVRFEVRSGDQYSTWSGERAQIHLPNVQGGEGERWHWRFTFQLDPAFQFSSGFYNILWQHHHTGSTGSIPSSLNLHADRLVWRQVKSPDPAQSNYWNETDLAPAVPGATVTVDVDCLLSTDATKAQTVVTVDGKSVTIPGPNLLTGMKVYPIWCLYRAPSPLTQVVTFGPVERFAA